MVKFFLEFADESKSPDSERLLEQIVGCLMKIEVFDHQPLLSGLYVNANSIPNMRSLFEILAWKERFGL
jgi:hypothetical protein